MGSACPHAPVVLAEALEIRPRHRTFVTPDAGCYFRSGTFDPEGIAAIEICGPEQTGGTTRADDQL